MSEKKQTFEGWHYCNNSALRRAARQLGQLYDDVLAPSGLKITQHTLLTQIHFNTESSLKALADSMVMDLSALGHTLKPLIRDGYVELVPDEKDRRVKRVRLTDFGRARWAEAHALWREAQGRFDRAFGEEPSKAMRAAMDTVSSKDLAARFKA